MRLELYGRHLNTVEEASFRRVVNRQHKPIIDGLTGFADHRILSETVESEIKRSKRSGREFAMLVFTLNRIKQINDFHVDAALDQGCRRLAHILRVSCRIIDTVARHGDDKIVIILLESGAEVADECPVGGDEWERRPLRDV